MQTTVRQTLSALTILCALTAAAQQPRITTAIDNASRISIPGTRSPRANEAIDAGNVPSDTPLNGITLVFTRTAAQEADLQSLLASQQDPASPLFHQWLTPDQFAARFGTAASDIAKVQSWLQQQGFTIGAASRSRDRVTFSGTAANVANAFGTELHRYATATETHFAPSSDITVPAALASSVRTVTNLSDFRPKPHVVVKAPVDDFTSGSNGTHFLTPRDVATIYDINPAYNSGYNGTNQTIVVVGQSAVVTTDITNFQSAAGVPVREPSIVLVPNSGTSAISSGDETESDLDLEYTSAIATGASIIFVTTGNSPNYGVFDSIEYAVTERLAPIISVSYGECEAALGFPNFLALNGILAQATAQGQTIIAASGDDGSTDCYAQTELPLANRQSLAVDFPADSQYVTGLGGTELVAVDIGAGNTTYWISSTGSDVISSAKSYIPEQVWNNDSSGHLSSGGGGISTLQSRPSWQAGVPGIPSGTFRLVPDIALTASPNNAGYIYCSSDTKSTGVTGSCTNGFRAANNSSLTVAGGTSFAAPIFAGMLAIINQSQNSTGQGLINPRLYTLASNATTYASAFHDITSGGNQCASSTTICTATGQSAFTASVGYDEASGLGSVDLDNLLKAWSPITTTTPPTPGSFTIAATALTIADGNIGTSSVTVTPVNGYKGAIAWSLTTPPNLTNACYTISNTSITGTAPVSTTLTVYTTTAQCVAAAGTEGTSLHKFTTANATPSSKYVILSAANGPASAFPPHPARTPNTREPLTFAFLGLLTFGALARKSRRLRPLLALAFIGALTAALSGCGSGGNPSPATASAAPISTFATQGTYTLTLTGTDTTISTVSASTTLALTIN